MSHSKFSDANGTNTVPPANNTPINRVVSPSSNNQLNQLQISTPPRSSVNVECPPGSSHDQPPKRKQRKRRQRTLLAMITEENNSNEITSLNNKYVELLEKSIKRQKVDLDEAKISINRETDMIDILCKEMVTCQICHDRNHTANACPQRYV